MFLFSNWYQCAWTSEISSSPIRRIILDRPIVLFRMADGEVVALEDRCSHQNVPLSMGSVVSEGIQCCYHGLVFDRTGKCIKVPGQTRPPAKGGIASFSVVERQNCVWIWMADRNNDKVELIPDIPWIDDERWESFRGYNRMDCDYQSINDNLLDLSHLAYLHSSTVGSVNMAEDCDVKVEEIENRVRITRWTIDTPPQRTYREIGQFSENIDRWQIVDFTPPCTHFIATGGAITNTGAPEGKPGKNRWDIKVFHTVTPETATSSHYFWCLADKVRERALPAATRALFNDQVQQVIDEDIAVLTARQENRAYFANSSCINIKYDAGALRARRILNQLIAAENDRSSVQ